MASIALVTGCAGFIGRVLVDQLLRAGHYVIGIDCLTYAARADLLPNNPRFEFVEQDVYDLDHLHGADVVFHLAAESHVDNGISDPAKFVQTNVGGTFRLLELLRGLRPHDRPTLIHVSTDETYGDVPEGYTSREDDPLCPSSPYSASKAAADMLVLAWQRTYDLKARIVRPSNCYGLGQYPEKLIPKCIRSALLGRRMTVHGDGTQTRMWLNIEDCAQALLRVWAWGEDGTVYTVPGNEERSIRWVVGEIHRLYREMTGNTPLEPLWGCERPGGDRAYRIDGELITRLGWAPRGRFKDDLEGIVRQELALGVRI